MTIYDDIIIRSAKLCDAQAIAGLEEQCFSQPWSVKSLTEELSLESARFFVAVFNEMVVGYIGATNVLGEVYISNVAVESAFRRHGLGRRLTASLIDCVRAENCEFVTLEVRKSNEAAKKLYLSLGFSVLGERRNFYVKPTEDALIMTLMCSQ